jgi:hypothetical protein
LKKARVLSLQVDIDFEDKDASGLKIEIPTRGKTIDLEGFLAVKELQVTCLEGSPVTVDQTKLPASFVVTNETGSLVHINYSVRGY